MKWSIIACCLLLSISSFAQTRKVRGNGNVISKEKKIENFSKIEVHDGIDVNILNNPSQNKLTIVGDANLHQIIETSVVDGKLILKIKDDIEIVNKTSNFKISLTSKEIEEISLKGSANVEGTGVNEILKLTINNEGSGTINLKIKTDELLINNSSSGAIVAEGNSNLISIKNSGSGTIDLENVSTFFSEVNLLGSGNILTNAVNGLDGKLSGSGNIYYKNTKTVNIDNTGSGQVIKK